MEKEDLHIIQVLESAKIAILQKDPLALKELSNQTIHSSCAQQDSGSITLAVLIYTLSKVIERKDYARVKAWDNFVKKFNSLFDLAIKAIKENRNGLYEGYLQKARQTLESISVNLKPYIQEVVRKASVNKASKIYEHGISLGQTANLLGVTQWELSEYAGQKSLQEGKQETIKYRTISEKERAKTTLEFFS